MANSNPARETNALESNAYVIDVTTDDFEHEVLQRSSKVPVLVDFWASWCQPCLMLGPILEKIAADLGGAFVLAKVDSDRNQELGARYGVQGIPNVLLFKDGAPVDRFVGAQPEARVKAFLKRHLESPADDRIAEAEKFAADGDAAAARRAYEEALGQDPEAHRARLGLARLALLEGDSETVGRWVGEIAPGAEEFDAGQALLQSAELAAAAAAIGDEAACAARVEADTNDVEAHFALGGHSLAAGEHRRALEHYLAAAKSDRHWRDEAARKAMLVVFNTVGVRDPLSDEFRDKLRRVYY